MIKHNYSHGDFSRAGYRLEALEPDTKKDNDGFLLHSLNISYTTQSWDSFHFTYSVLQPITGISGADRLQPGIELRWRKFIQYCFFLYSALDSGISCIPALEKIN